MKKNKHIGSSFEDFLVEDTIFEEVTVAAIKTLLAGHLKKHMVQQKVTQTEMARQLKTSRAGLQRLLDPHNYSITLLTLGRVASVLGKQVAIQLVASPEQEQSSRALKR